MKVFLDLLSNQPKNDETRDHLRRLLRERFEGRLSDCVERNWELPPIVLKDEGEYLELLLEARELYSDGRFYSCVAMCGIVGERLVKDALRTALLIRDGQTIIQPSPKAFDGLEKAQVSSLIDFSQEAGILSEQAAKSAKKLGDLRNRYAHAIRPGHA